MAIDRLPSPGAGIPTSTVTAKGDLIAGTANNAVSRLAVGADGTTLVADSSTSTGLKWATAAGGGKVLQVVQGTTSTPITNTTTTYADTTLSASITPSSTSSKILIFVMHPSKKSSGNSQNGIYFRIMRNSDSILQERFILYTASAIDIFNLANMTYLDSPSTNSSITYKTQFCNATNASDVQVQHNYETATIILMEIGA